MNKGLFILFAAAILCLAQVAEAQYDGTAGLSASTIYGIPQSLSPAAAVTLTGDYMSAGIGMRNAGGGTIALALPPGSSVNTAWLYWAIIFNTSAPPAAVGTFNGTNISGSIVGISGSPCWGGTGIAFYRANVSTLAVSGNNTLSNFPSGLTNGANPWSGAVFPLLEGATLIIAFDNPMFDQNTVRVYDGVVTFALQAWSEGLGVAKAWGGGNPADEKAKTTFVMADGQVTGSGDRSFFNGTLMSGPGSAIKTADAFNGADGIPVIAPANQGGLWDTHGYDVSSFYPSGVLTAGTATVSANNDCLSWGAQVLSTKSAIHARIDIKATSCPNPFNMKAGGKLPVAILGGPNFNVANVDLSTVKLLGVSNDGYSSMMDVSQPFNDFPSDCYDCNSTGPDTYTDLNIRFSRPDIATALASAGASDGDCFVATLMGNMIDGTPFYAQDVLKIIDKGGSKDPASLATVYELALQQNHPNPVAGITAIRYSLPETGSMYLAVYNTLGEEVAVLSAGISTEGVHHVEWDGTNKAGLRVPPGIYFYRLQYADQQLSRKLVLTR